MEGLLQHGELTIKIYSHHPGDNSISTRGQRIDANAGGKASSPACCYTQRAARPAARTSHPWHWAEGGEERGARGTRGLLGPCEWLPKGSAMQG